jgi:hypothetical protein
MRITFRKNILNYLVTTHYPRQPPPKKSQLFPCKLRQLLARFPTPPSGNGQVTNDNGNGKENGKLSKSAKKKLASLNAKKRGLLQKIKALNGSKNGKKTALEQRLQFVNQQIIQVRNGF